MNSSTCNSTHLHAIPSASSALTIWTPPFSPLLKVPCFCIPLLFPHVASVNSCCPIFESEAAIAWIRAEKLNHIHVRDKLNMKNKKEIYVST